MIATEYALARDGTGDLSRATERVERALLGAVMIVGLVPPNLPAVDDFMSESHRIIWQAILAVTARAQSPDLVLVGYELAKTDTEQRAGGSAYVSMLVDRVPCVDSIPVYARLVKEAARMRKFKRMGA